MRKVLKTLYDHKVVTFVVIPAILIGVHNGSHGLGLPDLPSCHLLHGGSHQLPTIVLLENSRNYYYIIQSSMPTVQSHPNQGADNPVTAAKGCLSALSTVSYSAVKACAWVRKELIFS